MQGSVTLLKANALSLPIISSSVDLIVTSPPYFALRSYQDGGEHYDGQIGAEATPREFVDALVSATTEMVRVLKPSGSIFVNLGDKYSRASRPLAQPDQFRDGAIRGKSLMGIPWRYALRCIDDLDLILRAEIIWAKTNGMPESVMDRVTRKHEQWFHFTKSETYYSNLDAIREPYISAPAKAPKSKVTSSKQSSNPTLLLEKDLEHNPLGKMPGSWWAIPTQPLQVPDELGIEHFAAFPTEWPRRLILGWSPKGICTQCGEPRKHKRERTFTGEIDKVEQSRKMKVYGKADKSSTLHRTEFVAITLGDVTCACTDLSAPTRPAIVLDPFGGTGTTAAVAKALGRSGISVDLSADYLRLADWRCNGNGYTTIYNKINGIKPAYKQIKGQEGFQI